MGSLFEHLASASETGDQLGAAAQRAARVLHRRCEPARFFVLSVPGLLLDLYNEVGRQAAKRRLPDGGIPAEDIARWVELNSNYGIQIVGPPLPAVDPTHPAAG